MWTFSYKQSTQNCNILSTFVPFSKGFLNSEVVSREITTRNIDTSSTTFGCLDQLALELDGESQVLGNWQSLAQKLGVTFQALKMLQGKSYSNRESTSLLFRHLHLRHQSMTVKTLKEALAKMKRGDVLKIFQEFHYHYVTGKFDGQTTCKNSPYYNARQFGKLS